jgi:hypothetical protein
LKNEFPCKIEAIAENICTFERLCTEDATEEKYTSSEEYAHIRDVLEGFKPNIITVYVGGGNTPAKDDDSLTLFYKVLYGLIASRKRRETVVICVGLRPNIYRLSKYVADMCGFISVDASFLHEKKGRENPYYAYRDYPEYDEKALKGAVEFRSHPNDLGHAAIANAIISASDKAVEKIPKGIFSEEYSYEKYISADAPTRLEIETEPQMNVSYFGFNIRQNGECVTLGSAPGTGASIVADGFCVPIGCKNFYVELQVDGTSEHDELKVCFRGRFSETEYYLPVVSGMHKYELTLPSECDEIQSLYLSPSSLECVITIRRIGFRE